MAKKKRSQRMLTPLDSEILKFIWRWKLANTMTLKYALAPQRSFWKFYKILRCLYREGYLQEAQDPTLQVYFWTLTKKGFEVVDNGLMNLIQKRYKPQSVLHDYWMMAFQLGDFVFEKPEHVQLVTEQEISARDPADLPTWLPKKFTHIPDGFTFIKKPEGPKLVALEVELSTKTSCRYGEMIAYLDLTDEIHQALWLCENEKIIELITRKIGVIRRLRPLLHNFVLLSDVQELGWGAPILWGEMKDRTVYELLGQEPYHKGINTPAITGQSPAMKVFLSKEKSPCRDKDLRNPVDPLQILTP